MATMSKPMKTRSANVAPQQAKRINSGLTEFMGRVEAARAEGELASGASRVRAVSAGLEVDTAVANATAAEDVATGTTTHSPITIVVNGFPIEAAQLIRMYDELAEARRAGEIPNTIAPAYHVEVVAHDYDLLTRLRAQRGDTTVEASTAYNALFVEAHRIIQQRDVEFQDLVEEQRAHDQVNGLATHVNASVRDWSVINHAVTSAIQAEAANGTIQGADSQAILRTVRNVVGDLANEGARGITHANMEQVTEEIFSVIEASVLDATGPMRLNASRIEREANRINTEANRMHSVLDGQVHQANRMHSVLDGQLNQVDRADEILTDVTTQVGGLHTLINALSGHVNAVGTHTSAVGTQITAVGTLANTLNTIMSVANNNIDQTSTQVAALQTIVNELPALIQRVIGELVRAAITDTVPTALMQLLPALITAIQTGAIGNTDKMGGKLAGVPGGKKVEKKRGFFARFFGFGKKHGRGGNGGDYDSAPMV